MKKKLFTLIAMLLPMMASAYDAGNSLNLYSWGETAEDLSEYNSDSDVSKTRAGIGEINVSLVLANVSNENIYITGFFEFALNTADGSDWAPIEIRINPVSSGYAQYLIPAGQTAVVPASQLSYRVRQDLEPVSKYMGGTLFRYGNGEPVYWRVYSWTSAHDPAVVKSTPGPISFVNGGQIVFYLNSTDQAREGRITPSSNPTVLGGGSIPQPQPEPEPEPQPQPQPQPDPEPEPEPEPQPQPQPVIPQCAKPSVDYYNDGLLFSSETEGATFSYKIYTHGTEAKADMKEPRTIIVSVIAKKAGYNDSAVTYEEIDVDGIDRNFDCDLTGDKVVNAADHVELTKIITEQEAKEANEVKEIVLNNNELTFPSESFYEISMSGEGNEVILAPPFNFTVTYNQDDEVIKREITVGMKGDLNGDGEINNADHEKLSENIIPEQEEKTIPENEATQEEETTQNNQSKGGEMQ